MDNLFEDLGINMTDPEVVEVVRLAMSCSLQIGMIRAERLVRGISVEAVAARMGISESDVRDLEKPGSDPALSTVRRYAMAVGVIVGHSVTPVAEVEE